MMERAGMSEMDISNRTRGRVPPLQATERLPVTRPCDLDALLPANWAAANRAAHPGIKSERPQAA